MRSLFKIRTLPPQSSVKLVVELHPQFAQQELHLPSKRKDSLKKIWSHKSSQNTRRKARLPASNLVKFSITRRCSSRSIVNSAILFDIVAHSVVIRLYVSIISSGSLIIKSSSPKYEKFKLKLVEQLPHKVDT